MIKKTGIDMIVDASIIAYETISKLIEMSSISMWYIGKGTGCLSRFEMLPPASRNERAYFSSSRMSAPGALSGFVI